MYRRFLDAAKSSSLYYFFQSFVGCEHHSCVWILRRPFWKFAAADAAAISYGVPLSFGLAYLFSRHLHAVLAEVHRVEGWIALLGVVGGGAWIYITLRRRGSRALATAAGPLGPGVPADPRQ